MGNACPAGKTRTSLMYLFHRAPRLRYSFYRPYPFKTLSQGWWDLFPSLGLPRTAIYIFQFPLLDAALSIAHPDLHALGVLAVPVTAEIPILHHGVDATTANRHIRTLQHSS